MPQQPPKKRTSVANGALLLSIGGGGCLFLGPWGALAGVGLGILALVLEWKAPDRYAGGGSAAAAILIGSAAVWFWRSQGPYISSRGELRYRSAMTGANEAGALGYLRELSSVEEAYAQRSGGSYAELACLSEPKKCVRDYPADGPALTGDWAGFRKTNAYLLTFHAGGKAGASGLKSYAVVALPRLPGETGRRAFCIDSTAIIRVAQDGSTPPVENGLCSASTPVLR